MSGWMKSRVITHIDLVLNSLHDQRGDARVVRNLGSGLVSVLGSVLL